MVVFIKVLESTRSDPDNLALFEPPKLKMHHLEEPNLIALVDHSKFTGVVIQLEQLHNLHLQVEVFVFAILILGP